MREREKERERERERERDQPPIGAAKLHETPTAQAAASSSFECASFCEEKKKRQYHMCIMHPALADIQTIIILLNL